MEGHSVVSASFIAVTSSASTSKAAPVVQALYTSKAAYPKPLLAPNVNGKGVRY